MGMDAQMHASMITIHAQGESIMETEETDSNDEEEKTPMSDNNNLNFVETPLGESASATLQVST